MRRDAERLPFGQYLHIVLGHQSLQMHGVDTGDIGAFGYVLAVLQILGFAAGGMAVFAVLRAEPFCEACNKYLKKYSSMVRYTSMPTNSGYCTKKL